MSDKEKVFEKDLHHYMCTFVCSLQGEYLLLWHNPISVNNGLPHFIVTIANSKGGYGRSLFWEMCYPHRTPNSFFPAHQSSCKGFGWIWILRPRFPALPIPQIKGSGLLQRCSTCPLITKDTACPRITIASRNWHHLMPGICTS